MEKQNEKALYEIYVQHFKWKIISNKHLPSKVLIIDPAIFNKNVREYLSFASWAYLSQLEGVARECKSSSIKNFTGKNLIIWKRNHKESLVCNRFRD